MDIHLLPTVFPLTFPPNTSDLGRNSFLSPTIGLASSSGTSCPIFGDFFLLHNLCNSHSGFFMTSAVPSCHCAYCHPFLFALLPLPKLQLRVASPTVCSFIYCFPGAVCSVCSFISAPPLALLEAHGCSSGEDSFSPHFLLGFFPLIVSHSHLGAFFITPMLICSYVCCHYLIFVWLL